MGNNDNNVTGPGLLVAIILMTILMMLAPTLERILSGG